MTTLTTHYIDVMLKCEGITRDIISNTNSTLASITILRKTISELEANVVTLNQPLNTSLSTLPKPIFLPEIILNREVKVLKKTIEDLISMTRNLLGHTLTQLSTELKSEIKKATDKKTIVDTEHANNYQTLLKLLIGKLEKMEDIISSLTIH